MSVFDALRNARTETELFVLLCSVLHTPTDRPLRAALVSVRHGQGLALELTIRQGMKQQVALKEIHLVWVITHVFTLPANASLVWWMKDQPVLSGLDAIHARLDQLRESFDHPLLTEHRPTEHV